MATTAALPFLTDPDPDRVGEGNLFPLGLTPIADRLADQIAPDITARMSRIRFVTAIAIGATMADEFAGVIAADGKSPAYLAYEWIVVESLARRGPSPPPRSVPGIEKARRALERSRSAHLDAGSYLQVPKVFGFHGVYKRLARGLGIVDEDLSLAPGGDPLVAAWEREQGWSGFAGRTPGSTGIGLSARLRAEVRSALREGRVTTAIGSHLWIQLAEGLDPDRAGPRERKLLWDRLVDDRQPVRSELVCVLRDYAGDPKLTDAEILRAIIPTVGPDLKARLAAIESYERVAHLLEGVLLTMRYESTVRGMRPVGFATVAAVPSIVQAAEKVPKAIRAASRSLPSEEKVPFEDALGMFGEELGAMELIEAVLSHHEAVQKAKGGKRAWLERAEEGFYVRRPYATTDTKLDERRYIHPYRLTALCSFIRDLGMVR
jgi:hypothetical protein